jgi:hypothetical protein
LKANFYILITLLAFIGLSNSALAQCTSPYSISCGGTCGNCDRTPDGQTINTGQQWQKEWNVKNTNSCNISGHKVRVMSATKDGQNYPLAIGVLSDVTFSISAQSCDVVKFYHVFQSPGYYTFTFRTVDANGNINQSGGLAPLTSTVTVVAAAATCDTPLGATQSNITCSAATLSWNNTTGNNGYDVQYKPSSVSSWTNATTLPSSTNNLNLTGLSASTTYNWRVRTNCATLSSLYSATRTFTTTSCGISACSLSLNPSPTDATSCQNNGSIDATTYASNGSGVNYQWSGGLSGNNPTGLAPGTYSVTATASGCTSSASAVTIAQTGSGCGGGSCSISVNPTNDIAAYGGGTGNVTLSVSANCTNSITIYYNGLVDGWLSFNGTGTMVITWTAAPNNTGQHRCATAIFDATADGAGTASFTVCQDPAPCSPTAAITTPQTTFCTGGSTILTATGSGSQFSWNDGSTSTDLTVTQSGVYTVIVSDGGSCTASSTVAITVNAAPSLTVSATDNDVCGSATTAIQANAPTATQWAWTGGATTATITGSVGTYAVTVTDNNYCTATGSTVITSLAAPTATLPATASFCAGGNVTVTVTTDPNNTIAWDDASTNTARPITAAGTYFVTVTNAFSCATTASVVVTQNAAPSINIADVTVCSGLSATLTATGAGNFVWNTSATTPSISVSSGGIYTAIVTDPITLCQSTATATVSFFPAVQAAINAPTTTICEGESLTLVASGGNADWGNGNTNAFLTVSPTQNTTYSVRITDANGCVATTQQAIVVNPLPIAIASSTTVCAGTTAIINASGGDIYEWNTGATTAALSTTTVGFYIVTVTEALTNCSATATGSVTVNPLPIAVLTPTVILCAGVPKTITAAGGGTYFWSNNTTVAATSLSAAGIYTVTVTGANTCTETASITATVDNFTTAITASNNAICPGGFTVLSVPTAVSYSWNTTATTQSITVSPTSTATYLVTVTNNNGCISTAAKTVQVNPLPALSYSPSIVQICVGDTTTVTALAPTATIYSWSSGQIGATASFTVTGTYSLTVTDGNGCVSTVSFNATNAQMPTPQFSLDNTNTPTTALVILNNNGISYYWEHGDNTFSVLPNHAHTYTNVNIPLDVLHQMTNTCGTDVWIEPNDFNTNINVAPLPFANLYFSNSATHSLQVVSTQPTTNNNLLVLANLVQTGAKMINTQDTMILFSVSPQGVLNWVRKFPATSQGLALNPVGNNFIISCLYKNRGYMIKVNPRTNKIWAKRYVGVSVPTQLVQLSTNEYAGTYQANGYCYFTKITATSNHLFTKRIDIPNFIYKSMAATSTGCAIVGEINANESVLLYMNNAGVLNWSKTINASLNSVVTKGQYIIAAGKRNNDGVLINIDANGNYVNSNLLANKPFTELKRSLNNGYLLNFTAGYAVLDSNFVNTSTHNWQPYAGVFVSTKLAETADGRLLLVADLENMNTRKCLIASLENNECVTTTSNIRLVNDNTTTVITNTATTLTTAPNLTASIHYSGSFIGKLNSQTYCTPASATISGTTNICTGQSTVLTATGGVTYLWSNGENTPNITVTNGGVYTVTVTNVTNSTATATVTITENALPILTVTGITAFCTGTTTTLTATGGNTYAWSNGTTTATNTVSAANTYTITATTANGCTASTEVLVRENATNVPIIEGATIVCFGSSTTIVAGGNTDYVWSNSATTAANTVSPTFTTMYTVTATNALGCTATNTIVVTVNPLPIINIAGNTIICQGETAILTASGGAAYTWSDADNTATADIVVRIAGVYIVTVTSAANCTATASQNVTVNILPVTAIAQNINMLTATGGLTYIWNTNETTSMITIIANGVYTVTITDANGCTNTASINALFTNTTHSNANNTIRITPNPTADVCFVEGLLYDARIEVFTALGQSVLTVPKAQGSTRLDLTVFQNGVYWIAISQNGALFTQKLIVQH